MAYTLDPQGNEVDERGYFRWAVEGWARHGIYPPPLIGDSDNPTTVAMAKEHQARRGAMSEEERAAARTCHEKFIRRWDAEHPEFVSQLT